MHKKSTRLQIRDRLVRSNKIGVVLRNKRVLTNIIIFIYLYQTRWSVEHTHIHANDYSFAP